MKTISSVAAAAIFCAGIASVLPGCQTESSRIPQGAAMVGSGTGNTSSQIAQDGTVYVYDKTWNKLVYTGEVKAGQIVKVDAWADKVYVDNQVVVEQIPLGEGSTYEIFSKPSGLTSTSTTTTTVQQHVVTDR